MHIYRQPIIVFGIVLPVVAAGVIVALGSFVKGKIQASYETKQANYKTYEMGRDAGLEMEAQVSKQHPHVERWMTLLAEETASAATNNLREIAEHLPSKEFQQTAFERVGSNGGFGTISAQSSSQIRIAFRGTYRTLQRAFLELETRMPQLQLNELRIDPSSSSSTLLNFQVTYTAWER